MSDHTKNNHLSHRPVWAWHPERTEHEAGYTLFRKTVCCPQNTSYHLAVSADNRITFYLDGHLLGRGPLRGDLDHYFHDEYQGTLPAGEHIFAAEAVVWSEAWRWSAAPWAEMHAGGGFMVAGFAGDERMELPQGWLVTRDWGRRPIPWRKAWQGNARIPAPPMDEVDFRRYRADWRSSPKPLGKWVTPAVLGNAEFRNAYQTDPDTPWNLAKRPLNQMRETFSPIAKILAGPKTLALHDGRLTGSCQPGKHTILLDLGRNQTFMVRFCGNGGNGTCRLAYSETLFDKRGAKTHTPPGTVGVKGYGDLLHLTSAPWQYDSFWYRSGRFLELAFDLVTPLTDIRLEIAFVTYPFGIAREFHSPQDPMLERIYQTACHTLDCCSHEHFEACPYYEQLQYAGDSRIEALASYAVYGKDDLGRHALRCIAASQSSDGLTQSRYPSAFRQVIPEYSLIRTLMLHDHYAVFGDLELVRELLPNVENMLGAFERARRPDGLVGPLPGWHYTDWVPGWPSGASDRGKNVPETILNLFYAEALTRTANLELITDRRSASKDMQIRAEKTLNAVNMQCYDSTTKRYLDSPGHTDWLSLHANVLAVLFGAVPEPERPAFLREIYADSSLKQMSMYFSFYLLAAIMKYGTPQELRAHYAPWEKMLDNGSTTFPEKPGPCRSECHAWSCAPAWFLLRSSGLLNINSRLSTYI
ncbi:MAG: hypothetical protein IJJ33_05485 [Victivallales bacterium]|nr:hypothetical protein [Victivallales bacterium]